MEQKFQVLLLSNLAVTIAREMYYNMQKRSSYWHMSKIHLTHLCQDFIQGRKIKIWQKHGNMATALHQTFYSTTCTFSLKKKSPVKASVSNHLTILMYSNISIMAELRRLYLRPFAVNAFTIGRNKLFLTT